jgi:hypothetical protein
MMSSVCRARASRMPLRPSKLFPSIQKPAEGQISIVLKSRPQGLDILFQDDGPLFGSVRLLDRIPHITQSQTFGELE